MPRTVAVPLASFAAWSSAYAMAPSMPDGAPRATSVVSVMVAPGRASFASPAIRSLAPRDGAKPLSVTAVSSRATDQTKSSTTGARIDDPASENPSGRAFSASVEAA